MLTNQEQYFRIKLSAIGPEMSGMSTVRLGQINFPESLRFGDDVFAEWHWDGKEIVVRNCQLGFFPIYYCATESEFTVATSIEKLLQGGAPADLDDAALAVFLRLGWMLGEDTAFRSIRMLPPAGEVRWSGGKPVVSGGYRFPARQNLSKKAAVAAYGELFRQSIKRRSSGDIHFSMPLSGGRDSRHILLELDALGYRPQQCFTNHDFPPYRKENISVAASLCQRLDIPHTVLGQPGSRLMTEIKKNRLNNYGAMENIWCISLYPMLAKRASIVYEGTGGDVLSAGDYLERDEVELYEKGRLEELADKLLEHWLSWRSSETALMRIATETVHSCCTRQLAVQHLVAELAKHGTAANPMTSFYFWNRTRRVAALQPFSIAAASGVMAVTPFLDHDLVDFLTSLPAEMYLDQTFHTATISKMHPSFDDLPYAGDLKTPRIENNWHYRRLLAESSLYIAWTGNGRLQNRYENARRLLSLSLTGGNLRMRMSWMAPFTAIYLAQLESLISHKSKEPTL